MTQIRPASAQLLSDWQQETREHADSIRKATELALRYGVNDAPAIADWIALRGVETEVDEGVFVSKDRIEPGPFVRVYDPTAHHGDGGYAWAKGRTIIPDHAVEKVHHQTDDQWDEIQRLSATWPVKPCSESYSESPAGDDDPQSYPEGSEYHWCPACVTKAPLVRYVDVWERVPHRVDGTVIEPA